MSGAPVAAGDYRRAADLPLILPVFPLDGVLLLPRRPLPLNIFEPRYLNMIDDAMAGERMIGMVQTRPGGQRSRPALARVGCAGRITSFAETADGRYVISLTGVCRFGLGPELNTPTPYRQVRASFEPFEIDLEPYDGEGLDRDALMQALRLYLDRHGMDVDWDTAREAPGEALVNSLASALPFDSAEKQSLLEAETLESRFEALIALLLIGAAGPDPDSGETPSLQ